jgi:hypothetical protein
MKTYAFVQNKKETDEKEQVKNLQQIMLSVLILKKSILFPL